MAIAGLYVAWSYVSSDKDFGFDIEWKFWNSSFLWPILSIIGFFLQFLDWQHTSFKEGWVVKDSWGREKFVENNDVISSVFGGCVFPLIAHLFIIPCAYGAVLYYVIIIPLENIVTHEMVRTAYKQKYPKKRCSGKVDITQIEYVRFMKSLRSAWDNYKNVY